MPLVPPSRPRRAGLIGAGAAALVVAITAAVTLTASPAAAATSVTPTANCVVKSGKDDLYRAVFGYTSTASQTNTIPAGADNYLALIGGSTQSTEATVTTEFDPGAHPASFATDWISKDTSVVWRVGGQSATAGWNQSSCGGNITLPAAGNGAGPVVALLLAGMVAVFVLWRKRRKAA